MTGPFPRRSFLKSVSAAGLLSLGDFGFLDNLPPVTAAESKLNTNVVRFNGEIDSLVRLVEDTPREKLLEQVALKIRSGLSYKELLTALLLAGVRNIQPRPSVGYKFHAVLVVNSAHLASISSPDTDRWLPIFWALDNFKSSQARDVKEGNWTMAPLEEKRIPPGAKAKKAFIQAMDHWDETAADAAVAGFSRASGANEIFELFFRYGARDFRSIGHKAIFVSNSLRTLQSIGWQHAEPVLRSLTYALLNHRNEPNPSKNDLLPDRPWRQNIELATKIRDDWQSGKLSSPATDEMLKALREGSYEETCSQVVEILNQGIAPQSIWDALFGAAAEMLMQKPGIVALHAVTSTNALHYAYRVSGSDGTRRMLLLQNTAFLSLFRKRLGERGVQKKLEIGRLKPIQMDQKGTGAIEEIFSEIGRSPLVAAQKTLAFLETTSQAKTLIDHARRLLFLKGNNAHDYKYSSAVLEDYYCISPGLRNQYLAASMFRLRGTKAPDNELVKRIRSAFAR